MITIKEIDYKLQRIVAYVAAVPILVLLFLDYIVKDNQQLASTIDIIGSILLIVLGLFGAIYFGIIASQKPKTPFKKTGKVEDAEFKEK